MKGAWVDIWASFKSVVAATASLTAFVLAMLGSLWDPGITIRVGLIWLAVFGFLVVSVVATAIRMSIDARRLAQPPPPRIVDVLSRAAADDNVSAAAILIIDRSPLFSVNVVVTIYHEAASPYRRDEIIEEAIGIGRVINIQRNGLIQIQIVSEEDRHAVLWQRLKARETAILPHVIIRPSVDFNAVGIEVPVR